MKKSITTSDQTAIFTARIIRWDRKKGYGFLQLGDKEVFLHHRTFLEHFKKPEVGDRIRFTLGRDQKGRSCAQNAVHDSRVAGVSVGSFYGFAALLALPISALGKFSPDLGSPVVGRIAAYLLIVNTITFWVYASDKRRARISAWRTPEIHMHLLELLGGWPGAFFAQRRFNHKRTKGIYQTVYWTIVLFHQLIAFDYVLGWKFTRFALTFFQSLSVDKW